MPSYVRGRQARTLTDAEIIRLYVEEGQSSDDVGNLAGCSPDTVRMIVRNAGQPVRPRGIPPERRPLTDAEICQAYRAGRSAAEIAALAQCSPSNVIAILRKHGVPRRSPGNSEAARLSARRRRQQQQGRDDG